MASYKALAVFGCVLVNIIVVIQSAPVDIAKEVVPSSSQDKKPSIEQALFQSVDSDKTTIVTTGSPSATISPRATSEKKKRYIDDNLLAGLLNSDSDELENLALNNNHVLHLKTQEIPATIHDNADKPVDTDDSNVFSDITMTPSDLMNVRRRRRDVKFNDQSNQRRKRALTPYEFYETDSFYDPYGDLIEEDEEDEEEYDRPMRSFAPLYWYPRPLRSAYLPSLDETYERPQSYSSTFDDDNDENLEFDDDNDIDYEPNEYPILLRATDEPIDIDEYRQQYDTEDLPIERVRYGTTDDSVTAFDLDDDDDDDDEELTGYYSKEHPLRFWIV